ncbi:hypothetical protein QBC39DRAFT_369351 [Podospora conica]|nr:hypothetical protein QBC39DRAFT_369351 [Schizothecium conicum]
MNTNYLNQQQFQLAQNQNTPNQNTPNQTPSNPTPRPRVETPIHPPQVPPQSSTPSRSRQLSQQQRQQQQQQQQQQKQQKQLQQLQQLQQRQQQQPPPPPPPQQQQHQQRYNVQAAQQSQQAQQTQAAQPDLTLQPPSGPPTAAFHASRLPPQPDLSEAIAAQAIRDQETATQLSIEPVFHRVGDPPQAPLKRSYFQPPYGTYNAESTPQGQQTHQVQTNQIQQAQQAQRIMQLAQDTHYSPGPNPHGAVNAGTGQGSPRAPAQQHLHPQLRQDQDADPSTQLHDESMQELQEEVYRQDEDDDEEMDDGNNDQGGSGENTGFNTDPSSSRYLAPLMLPITELQLPSIRPTLKLGPYDTREEAMNTVQEYAIVQGYVLVLTGCAKQKKPNGQYTGEAEVVRVDLMCDRGGICKNSGTGKRKRPTHKIGCPARIKLVCKKRQASKWFIEIRCEEHNHDLDPSKMHTIAAYRRWRRVQAGGPTVEPLKERHERTRKPKVMPPVPPPKFHQVGGLHSQPPANPTSPLHMAALKGQCKIIDILLNKGADINNLDQTGRTPLHCAVEGQRMDAVTKLMAAGADVTIKDVKGISALAMAVEKGMEDAVVLFIEAGADPNQ